MGNEGPSGLEVTILSFLVGDRELYGLEMIERSEGALKRGSIYATLHRMEEKGWVESRKEARAEGADRHPSSARQDHGSCPADAQRVGDLPAESGG